MPQINVSEQDNSKYADQQFISISYNGNTNSLPMPEGEITITENDTYNISQYATAIVNVPNPSAGTLNITENNEYDVTEYANVNVDVPNPSTGTLDIIENGEYDVNNYAVANVNVESGAELNIAYGDTAPEDTSKLWIKAAEPSNLEIDKNLENGVESLTTLSEVLSVADASVASIRVGDKIYLFGGDNTNKIQIFDSVTKNVSVLSVTLPYQLAAMGISVVGNKIYLFGGYSSINVDYGKKIYVFDTTDNTLSEIATFPVRIYASVCAAIGTDIYIFGGVTGVHEDKTNNIMLFDTINNQLITLSSATLPLSLSHCGAATIGTNIYVFGGLDVNGTRTKKILSFDGITQTISELSVELPIGLGGCSCVAFSNNIYIFGGLTNSGVSNAIYVFNAETNNIRLLSTTLPTAIRGAGADCVAKNIYIFGGHNGTSATNAILEFTVTFPLTKNNIFVQEDLLKNRFDLLSTPTKTTIGVSTVYKGNEDNEAETVEAYLYNEDTEQWELIN